MAKHQQPRPESRVRQTPGRVLGPADGPDSADPSIRGLDVFQRAMEALQRHSYEEASRYFHELLDGLSDERAVLDRSRVYLTLCQRELRSRAQTPRTLEERLTAATAALNNDDDVRAEELVAAVLEAAPRHELALYLMAVVQARRGADDHALSFLGRAIASSPEVRAQARHDADFRKLHGREAFRQLIELPSPTVPIDLRPPSLARRPRRSRSEP
jgi:thioredoxin-like negative regulator of GroEL